MGANNTPIPDLIELSSINANATFTVTPGGGGDIIGVVDNGTYTDGDPSNTSTQLTELSEFDDSNAGTITIDGTEYNIRLAVPDSSSDFVTVTYNNGASTINLTGDGGDSQVVFITASPLGGGSDRFFMAVDDGIGDLPDITSIQVRDLDFTPAGDDVEINLDQDNNVAPVCFTPGVRILTPTGERAIETLEIGDMVMTEDAGPQPIRWIGRRTMVFTADNAGHKPVEIKAGAFGDLPHRSMAVSPQHRIVLAGEDVAARVGECEVLALAKGMTGHPGIRVMKGKRRVTYITLLLDRHHVITAEGLKTESFYPGPMALDLLPAAQRLTIEALFPALFEDPKTGYGAPARHVLTRRETEDLVRYCKRPVARSPKPSAKILPWTGPLASPA